MSWQYTPHVRPLFLAVTTSVALAYYAWRRRTTACTTVFVLLILVVAQWSPGYALALEFVDLLAKTFWAKVQYLSDLSSVTNLSLTPFTFALSSFLPLWNISRFRLLDIKRPPPRDVIDGISIGMIMLDIQNRIIDLNSAAQQIIGPVATNAIGCPIDRVLVDHAELIERYRHVTEARTQITLGDGETRRYYDFHISPMINHQGHLIGRVIALYNRPLTARK